MPLCNIRIVLPFDVRYTYELQSEPPFMEQQPDGSWLLWMSGTTPAGEQLRLIAHWRESLPPALPCLAEISRDIRGAASAIQEVS
jgi:hypothetical protein